LADHTGFLDEAIAGLSAGEFGWEKLNGDNACDQRIEGAGHSAIGTNSDDFENFVSADFS
jgi:hypothetical protein